MRLLGLPLAIAGSIGIVALTLGATGDATLLVPPPEVVAESFYRQIESGRYDRARPLLSERQQVTTDSLRRLHEALERRSGPIEHVEGLAASRADTAAVARVELRASSGTSVLRVELVRERRLWKISRLVS